MEDGNIESHQSRVSMACSYSSLSFLMDHDRAAVNSSNEIPDTTRREVDGILAKQFSRAQAIVSCQLGTVEAMAEYLLERKTLEPEDVQFTAQRFATHQP